MFLHSLHRGNISWYPRAESNRNRQNRNLKFYPLNYGGKNFAAKVAKNLRPSYRKLWDGF